MKSCLIALISILGIFLVNPITSKANCDGCSHSHCKSCDDRGLLDSAGVFFSRVHASLCAPPKGKCKHGCDGKSVKNSPSCGCEVAPSCGCEAAPCCGSPRGHVAHEIPAPQQFGTPVYQFSPRHPGSSEIPTRSNPTMSRAAPQTLTRPIYTPAPVPPTVQPSPPASRPDSEVDPFSDDSASRVRKIPAKTIQFKLQKSTYGKEFDPQAQNVRVQFRDNLVRQEPVSTQSVASSGVGRGHSTTRSSRGLKPVSTQPPAVVTASGTKLLALPLSRAKPMPKSVPEIENPLRR